MAVPRRYWAVYVLLNGEHLSKVQTYLRNRNATQYMGVFMLSNVRIDLDHGTTMFVGGLLVLNLDRIEREVCVCAHVRVYTFSMCVHILNLVHVLRTKLRSIVHTVTVSL